jgi:gentisate 1,2-dioxygenase
MTTTVPEHDDYDPDSPELSLLYDDFKREHLTPLWTQLNDLMPMTPAPRALPHVWRWGTLYPLAERSGDLVPVGRGGERRAIALANPGLPGTAYATPTLWAAIQYLGPHETAPEHRHSQNAFRFVVEGEGVWTVVNGDPVAMRRGDFLLTPGWNFHGHHNETDKPMAWIDGLDIPLVHYTDTGFFEFGSERVTDEATPDISRSERLWSHPGLRPPSGLQNTISSPIGAYRWEHTDAALREQLELEHDLDRSLHNPVRDRRNRERPLLRRPGLGNEHPAGWKRTPTTLLQPRGHLVQQPGRPVLLDISDGDTVDTRRAAVAAHVLPRPLQDVSAIDLVPQRVEPSPGIGLGRPVQRMLQGPNRVRHGPQRGGTSQNGTHRAPPRRAIRTDEAAALPSPAVVMSARLNQYYGRLRRPPSATSTSRRQPVIGPASPVTNTQVTGPGRASPVPVVTI